MALQTCAEFQWFTRHYHGVDQTSIASAFRDNPRVSQAEGREYFAGGGCAGTPVNNKYGVLCLLQVVAHTVVLVI